MAADSPSSQPQIHVEHWCEHPGCKKWGSFGFELVKGQSVWFCLEHKAGADTGRSGRPQ